MIAEILLAIPGLVLLWILVTYVEHLISLRKYPKGPFPLPLVGNLLSLSEKPFLDFIEMSKRYGDVFSISFGKNYLYLWNKNLITIDSCSGGGVLSLPTDGDVRAKFRKIDPTWDSFFEKKWPWMGQKFQSFLKISYFFSQIFQKKAPYEELIFLFWWILWQNPLHIRRKVLSSGMMHF